MRAAVPFLGTNYQDASHVCRGTELLEIKWNHSCTSGKKTEEKNLADKTSSAVVEAGEAADFGVGRPKYS